MFHIDPMWYQTPVLIIYITLAIFYILVQITFRRIGSIQRKNPETDCKYSLDNRDSK